MGTSAEVPIVFTHSLTSYPAVADPPSCAIVVRR